MEQKKELAARVLENIARTSVSEDTKIEAAKHLAYLDEGVTMLEPTLRWYQVSTRDLTVFFLKCALSIAPAAMVLIFMYIFTAIFVQVAPNILGL